MNYLEALEQFLLEAKKQKGVKQPAPAAQPVAPQKKAVVETCPMFDETARFHRKDPVIADKLQRFIDFKLNNPLAQFGKSDKSTSPEGVFTAAIPGIRHAHLTFDVSIWYSISGANPTRLRLYAVLTHDESGTGQPAKISKQKTVADRMQQQSFKQLN